MTEPQQFIDAREVARRLGVSAETVLEMARDGRIPRLKLGKHLVRFEWDAVLEALRDGSREAE